NRNGSGKSNSPKTPGCPTKRATATVKKNLFLLLIPFLLFSSTYGGILEPWTLFINGFFLHFR
ncbi:hypothetical protein KKH65_04960, partial [bacterium]|nr:hypothetical protein [bacterium]